MASTGLAQSSVWSGKIYSDGWRSAEGGALTVTDKSTGERLGEIGRASVKDVASAATSARESQRAWAALPGPHRGDIVRKASQLVLEYADEIAAQIVRETGSIRPKGRAEAALTAREILEAAALASQPTGFITARRRQTGVVSRAAYRWVSSASSPPGIRPSCWRLAPSHRRLLPAMRYC